MTFIVLVLLLSKLAEFTVLRFADSEWQFYEFPPPMGIVP
jgi:hypothetical protein